jgi:hypothetical protein
MPRVPTNNRNAEAAVQAFINDLTSKGWGLNEAWLAIARQLMTCEIWDELRKTWVQYYNQPVLRERNDYKLLADGSPNQALQESTLVGDYIAQKLNIPRQNLCNELGIFMKALSIQPNNPRGRFFWTCGETEGVANSFLGKMYPEALLDKALITHQVCL